MNYYYKSEFELIESFLDAAGDPVDITNIDIEIVYYTSGWERYTVSRIGGVPVNCVFSEAEPTKLTVVFQNHGLGRGILSREITLLIDNVNFASGKQKVMLAPLTSINLVATSGEQGTAEATPVVVVSSSIFENIKYYYKTDFELIEQFFDSEGEAIDITNIDIQIIYLSQWGEYIVSKTSAGINNCYLDELDSTKLHVVFQNHGLKEGALRKEITLLIDNVNFASGKQKVMLNQETGVELVATGGDQGIGSGSNSIPVIVQSHTMPEKENIVDDDEVSGFDSEDNFKPIRYKKSKIKAFFKAFFDTVYAPIAEYLTSSSELEGLETNAKTITGSINEVRRIVLGATPSWVFDTEADMETWLADPENIAKLQTGNNLLIRDINVPDYWWDGEQAMELEVKIDLTNYYNKTEIGNLLGAKANLSGGNSISGNQNFDSNTFFVDSVNHRVGVGTNTPSEGLEILNKIIKWTLNDGVAYDPIGLRIKRNITNYGTFEINAFTKEGESRILSARGSGRVGASSCLALGPSNWQHGWSMPGNIFFRGEETILGAPIIGEDGFGGGTHKSLHIGTPQRGTNGWKTADTIEFGTFSLVANHFGGIRPAIRFTALSFEFRLDNTTGSGNPGSSIVNIIDSKVGIGTTTPAAKLDVNGSVKIGNDTVSASVANAGAIRYRADANNSYVEMCMQTGASTYAWIIIKQNTW